jgi:hypothetical protein
VARARVRGFFVGKQNDVAMEGGCVSHVSVCVYASVSPVCLSFACLCLGVRFEGLPWPVGEGKVEGPCPLISKCHIYTCLRIYVLSYIHTYIRIK